MIFELVKYVLAAAFRDKILIAFLVLTVVGISMSLFLGSSSISEKDQFAVVFAASSLRVASLITLILFTVFYVRKSFETKDVEYMLSRPVSRLQFLAAHSITFSILAFILASITTILLSFMPGPFDLYSYLFWGLSLFVELVLVTNVALFFSFVLSSAVVATLATLAFYTLARMIGGILGVIAAGTETGVMQLMEKLMLLISMVIPRLDLMAQSSWLIYGTENSINWMFVIGQGIVFYALVFSATYIDFKRKQF